MKEHDEIMVLEREHDETGEKRVKVRLKPRTVGLEPVCEDWDHPREKEMSERLDSAVSALRYAVALGQPERDTVLRILAVRESEVASWRQHAVEEDLSGLAAACARELDVIAAVKAVLRFAGDDDE